jgi:hypothetical protein
MKVSRFVPLLLFVFLVLAGASLPAQTSDASARKLTWALKVQAYQPLSWLAEPLNGKRDYPFTPRFWTGEVELGFSERSSVQASFGIRRYRLDELNGEGNPFSDHRDGIKLTLAYRNYLSTPRWGRMEGLFVAPFARWAQGYRVYDFGAEWSGEISSYSISGGLNIGWQYCAGKHLLLDLQFGPEIGYQFHRSPFLEYVLGDDLTSLDHGGYVTIRQKGTYNPEIAGLGMNVAFGIGWKF